MAGTNTRSVSPPNPEGYSRDLSFRRVYLHGNERKEEQDVSRVPQILFKSTQELGYF